VIVEWGIDVFVNEVQCGLDDHVIHDGRVWRALHGVKDWVVEVLVV